MPELFDTTMLAAIAQPVKLRISLIAFRIIAATEKEQCGISARRKRFRRKSVSIPLYCERLIRAYK